MTCDVCGTAQAEGWKGNLKCKGIHLVNSCATGEVPHLSNANKQFLDIFLKIEPGLFSQGRNQIINFNAISTVFDVYQVAQGIRPVFFEKILIIIEIREAERLAFYERQTKS